MLDFNLDNKTLMLLNSKKAFESLDADDFISEDNFIVEDLDGVLIYKHIDTIGENTWSPNYRNFFDEIKSDKYDLMIECTYEKYDSLEKFKINPRKIISLKFMTYEILDVSIKNEFDNNSLIKKVTKTSTIKVKSKYVMEKDIEDSVNGLEMFIKEFQRDNKLNNLGI
jgi:hypothetical protein